jgi:hypothetical protein
MLTGVPADLVYIASAYGANNGIVSPDCDAPPRYSPIAIRISATTGKPIFLMRLSSRR